MTVLVNRAKMTTATTGTGTITLGSAVAGYQSFADAGVTNGQVVRYVIEDDINWEIGTGTYTSTGTTLSRTVNESSNADAAISLSGTAQVYITAVAADILQPDNNLSDLTNAATARTNLGLAIGTNVQAYDADLAAIAGLAVTDGNIIVGNGSTWVAENGATARTSLGLTIGTNVQAYDAGLQSISGLTTSANQMIYTTASDTYATTSITAAGRAILDDADASAQRATLGLVIGTNVQAYDADLAAIAGLAVTDGNFIVGNGTTWVAESGSTARTSLGLGSIATQASNNVSITGGSISGITDLAVADGGTGVSTVPTNGQLLIGNGAGYTVASVTAGTGISVTNGSGSISISATNNGTVTSVGGTGTVNGMSLSGTVTSSGNLTLGGTLAISDADWSGTDLSVANGGTGASSFTANTVLLGNGTSSFQTVAPGTSGNVLTSNGTTWTSAAPAGGAVQYPQESKSADYTLVLADAGKQIFHPASDANIRTFTIPANSSVAFPVGTVVLFTAERNGRRIKVSINSDTLVTNKNITGTVSVGGGNTLYCIKVTSTEWYGYFMYNALVSEGEYAIAVAHTTTPNISAYPWSINGFGTKFSNPSTLPPSTGYTVAFSPSGDAIAVAHATTPFISAYPWSGSGFGTKFADPSTLPASTGFSVAFSPSGDAIAVAHTNTPRISAYPWSGSGFGTKFSNPSTLPTGDGRAVAFSPSGDAIAVAHATTPFISAYPWSGSGFGTKFANPSTLPANTGTGVDFSPSGDAIAVAHTSTPYISVYPWSGSGFGTKFADPSTLPTGNATGVAFSPSGDAIAVAHATTPNISAYPWSSSGFGIKFENPSTLPASTGNGVAFSPSGDTIAVAHASTPYISAYPWSGSGFGTKFANPSTLPTGAGNGVAFTAV